LDGWCGPGCGLRTLAHHRSRFGDLALQIKQVLNRYRHPGMRGQLIASSTSPIYRQRSRHRITEQLDENPTANGNSLIARISGVRSR
jgi:hypothetical protein